MGLYKRWCNSTKEKDKRKNYWTYVEKDGGRDEIRDDLAETIRSHYDRLERIAEDVGRLGYKVAAKILSEAMPQTDKGRSGDLGEILATELVEEEIGLRVPVRRLRYKDGRNMAMRGDDFIGASYDGDGEKLWLLKGEAKSNKKLGKSTVTSARMRAVEEAFTYRLVWALEAVRTRRMSLGWSPDTVAGGAAATVETGVPQFMMAMLIRAGLPSRRAAMAAIEDAMPVFVTPAEMRAWLESDEITAYTDAGDWPTPDTAALWARFRTEALSGGIQKWSVERYKRLLDIEAVPPAGLYRIVTDEGDGRTWLATPDYHRVAAFKRSAVDPKPSLFSGRLSGDTRLVEALRVGRGKLLWPRANE